jgi:thiol-disulfide isomerase/thioredoxin
LIFGQSGVALSYDAPIIDELSKEFEGKAKIGKVNVDEEMELAEQFGFPYSYARNYERW